VGVNDDCRCRSNQAENWVVFLEKDRAEACATGGHKEILMASKRVTAGRGIQGEGHKGGAGHHFRGSRENS